MNQDKIPPVIPEPTASTKGTVLEYSVQTNSGTIAGDNSVRYGFDGREWRSQTVFSTAGMRVDFVLVGNAVSSIYPMGGNGVLATGTASGRQCDRLVAGLLGIFLGSLGIHKFYLGYQTEGIILLLCGTIGWFLIFPGACATIIGLIEGIVYLSKSQAQFEQDYLLGRRGWF